MINIFRGAVRAFLILLLLINSLVFAVDTTQIDEVRGKEVLDTADFEVIDTFVDEAIQQLLETKDFSSISVARNTILSRSSSDTISAREQYAQQFFSSAARYLKEAFNKTKELTTSQDTEKIRLNLMILLDNLEDLRLSKLAVEMLDEENTAVRYWAVHAVSNPVIAGKLNSSETNDPELLKAIMQGLRDRLTRENCPEIISLIVDFAGNLEGQEGRRFLLEIADDRIQKYASWKVDFEFLDNKVLVLLSDAILSRGVNKADVSQRFAQLYSFAMQRYIMSMNDPNLLDSTQKQQLASVLVDVEQKCIGKLTEISQSAIKSAIEKDKSSTLLIEHNSLFGSEDNIGRLVRALDFDYGQNPDGSRRLIPRLLPSGPAKVR
jgi:hypothetical protein